MGFLCSQKADIERGDLHLHSGLIQDRLVVLTVRPEQCALGWSEEGLIMMGQSKKASWRK